MKEMKGGRKKKRLFGRKQEEGKEKEKGIQVEENITERTKNGL